MDAAVQQTATDDRALEAARKAFLEDPASLTIYTKASGERALRGRVHGKLDERLRAAIEAWQRHR